MQKEERKLILDEAIKLMEKYNERALEKEEEGNIAVSRAYTGMFMGIANMVTAILDLESAGKI